MLLLLLPLSVALALTGPRRATIIPTRDCSYFGRLTSAGDCECFAPWQGARCNALPGPPAHRDYSTLLRGSGITVAVCNPVNPAELSDCTAGLAAALRMNGTVLVPRLQGERGQPTPWRVRGFIFRADNARVVFEAGAEVQALKNSTYIFACDPVASLATANHRRNLSIIGWDASWRMWRDDYVSRCHHSEFRMGFSLSNCSDTEVVGLKIHNTGGD